MIRYLEKTLEQCKLACTNVQIDFNSNTIQEDFVQSGTELLWSEGSLFQQPFHKYTHCIMNPPYKKIRSDSQHRQQLRQINVETSNLYSAFVAIAIKMLVPNGQLVAIIPRSFCNGVYFKPFRQLLLNEMAIRHIHVFTSRTETFKENDVLQENIIVHAIKAAQQDQVTITASSDPGLYDMTQRAVPFSDIVKPDDNNQVIHIATNQFDQLVIDRLRAFTKTLDELGIRLALDNCGLSPQR
ncbi:MAG: Eco57I restriction-modification methylase domain-containing protein [Caldilineaceae bacterium]